ncbi:hypothetical protein KI387_034579, partial [Taxus chinensis]
ALLLYIGLDAFYTDEGLESLSQGGTPPRFLIIDDVWQHIYSEVEDAKGILYRKGC